MINPPISASNLGWEWSINSVISTESTSHSEEPSIAIDSANNVHMLWEDVTDYDGAGSGDWDILTNYIGRSAAGGLLKDTGTIEEGTGYWKAPNTNASNQYGFTLLPGGFTSPELSEHSGMDEIIHFSTLLDDPVTLHYYRFSYDNPGKITSNTEPYSHAATYVRCIKDPE